MWQTISGAIDRLPRKDGSMLSALEPLLTAGFLSRRRGIVNISIKTWNATFGQESSLRYPSRLEKALQRLRNTVEISVPSLTAAVDGLVSSYSFVVIFSVANVIASMIRSFFTSLTPVLWTLSRNCGALV